MPVVQYLFDEASSGTSPTSVADSEASPVNLTPTYGASSAWTSIVAGNGLGGISTENLRCVSATLGGTKVATAFHGLKKMAVEMVVRNTAIATSESQDFFVLFDNGGGYQLLFLFAGTGTNQCNLEIWSVSLAGGGLCGKVASVFSSTAYVLRVDFDTAQATASNRIKVWINGSAQTVTDLGVTQDTTLSVSGNAQIYTHGSNDLLDPLALDGAIYYLSLDDVVPSDDNSTNLLADNDADPGVQPPALESSSPADNATGVSKTASISLTFDINVDVDTGNVTLYERRLSSSEWNAFEVIPITDGRVSVSTDTVTINPASDLRPGHEYAVQVASTCIIPDGGGPAWAGIQNFTSLSFTTAEAELSQGGGLLVGSGYVGESFVGATEGEPAPPIALFFGHFP